MSKGRPLTVYVPAPDCDGTAQPVPRRTTRLRAAISRPRCSRPSMDILPACIYYKDIQTGIACQYPSYILLVDGTGSEREGSGAGHGPVAWRAVSMRPR